MAQFKAQLIGAPEAIEKFTALDKAVALDYMDQSMQAGIEVIGDAIIRNAPVNTGTLRGAIQISTGERVERKVSKVIAVDKSAWYWRFLEYGTRRGITPMQFVHRAFRNRRTTAKQTIRDTFRDLIMGFTK